MAMAAHNAVVAALLDRRGPADAFRSMLARDATLLMDANEDPGSHDAQREASGRAKVATRAAELRDAYELGRSGAGAGSNLPGVKVPAQITAEGETRSVVTGSHHGSPCDVGVRCEWTADGEVSLLELALHPGDSYTSHRDYRSQSTVGGPEAGAGAGGSGLAPPFVVDRPAVFPPPSLKVLRVSVWGLEGAAGGGDKKVNPYVVLQLGDASHKLDVQEDTADPEWQLEGKAFREGLPRFGALAASGAALELDVLLSPPSWVAMLSRHKKVARASIPLAGLDNAAVSTRQLDLPMLEGEGAAHIQVALMYEDAEALWAEEEMQAREGAWSAMCGKVDRFMRVQGADGGCVVS